jgi:hypothetical protein
MKGQISKVLGRVHVCKRVAVTAVLFGLLGLVPHLAVTQEQNEVGPERESEAQPTPLIGVTSSTQNPLQIALLQWYDANLTTRFTTGFNPYGVAKMGSTKMSSEPPQTRPSSYSGFWFRLKCRRRGFSSRITS